MVNPGVFHGYRKEFLVGQKPYYATAVAGDYAKDAVAVIQRRFFKRFPVEIPMDVEPSAEFLASVSDDDPDPELPEIDSTLEGEALEAEVARRADRSELIAKRKGQISRWLNYQYMKDTDVDPKEGGGLSPHRLLLLKLTGKGVDKPRQKTPCNIWRKTQRAQIEVQAKLEQQHLKSKGQKADLITIRDRIAREAYSKLSSDEKAEWKGRAVEEHAAALRQFDLHCSQPPATDPESRQQAIQELTAFIQPILDLVCLATGWKASFVAGGPEPAKKGGISILSIHSGDTKGDVKMNFGRAERVWYRDNFVRVYGSFLRKCYSPEDCRNVALDSDSVVGALDPADLAVVDANLDEIPMDHPSSTPSRAATPAIPTSAQASASNKNIAASHGASNLSKSPSHTTVTSAIPLTTNIAAQPSMNLLSTSTIPLTQAPISNTIPLEAQDGGGLGEASSTGIGNTNGDEPVSPGLGHFNAHFQLPPESPLLGMPPLPPAPSPTLPGQASLFHISPAPSPPPHSPSLGSSNHIATERQQHSSKSTTPTRGVASAVRDFQAAQASGKAKRKRGATVSNALPSNAMTTSSITSTSSATTGAQAKRPRHQNISNVASPTGSSTLSQHVMPVVPDDAPEWFKNAHAMFSTGSFGSLWVDALSKWSNFETAEEYKATPNLKATHRPPQVAKWVKNYRSPTFRLPITDVQDYSQCYVAWWTCLQPTWRVEGGTIISGRDGDWSTLRRSGINGLIGVMAALFFWGENLTVKEYTDGIWADMVKDLIFVCSQFEKV